jgi:hypothetical protein
MAFGIKIRVATIAEVKRYTQAIPELLEDLSSDWTNRDVKTRVATIANKGGNNNEGTNHQSNQ